MVRFSVLASGSKGNCTVITGGRTRILVDAGLSCRELFRRMQLAGEDPQTLDAILITHEHADHVGGVAVTARKLGIPVYFTEPTHRAWKSWLSPRKKQGYTHWIEQRRQQAADDEARQGGEVASMAAAAEEPEAKDPARGVAVEHFRAGQPFQIGDLTIDPFTIPHDAADPVGFVFAAEGVRIAVATDLGYLSSNVKERLKNLDLLFLESNHDLEMLRDGPYPWPLKQRVLSRVGHLSNDATAEFLASEYDGHAAYVILAHLSENNNHPDLARVAAERALRQRLLDKGNHLLLAEQHTPLSSLSF